MLFGFLLGLWPIGSLFESDPPIMLFGFLFGLGSCELGILVVSWRLWGFVLGFGGLGNLGVGILWGFLCRTICLLFLVLRGRFWRFVLWCRFSFFFLVGLGLFYLRWVVGVVVFLFWFVVWGWDFGTVWVVGAFWWYLCYCGDVFEGVWIKLCFIYDFV